MVLQPSEERRRSGSHYTPRALTQPIVRTTLEPILARLRGTDGRPPRPAQILDLKVCDPAMGSGAFLVEACRQLGDALVETWHAHGEVPAKSLENRWLHGAACHGCALVAETSCEIPIWVGQVRAGSSHSSARACVGTLQKADPPLTQSKTKSKRCEAVRVFRCSHHQIAAE